ncbi:BACON domain-containing protein [Odoribacter splanchnicus]|uniref:BACON domain-containing protein n=1 Tax=Odoribacter splanchnicus TaxID=28118 RepID=UPI00232F8E64|nr:BACON domain-containing protein [Odoribacter splanchnicus]MDB9210998.1 BACON domain-containing protein [Odoribacter splanchnicus]
MKRLFYLLMMLSCTLWSCSKSDGPIDDPDDPDNPDTPTNVTLDISVSDLVFEAEGGEKEFTIYCNSDWTITNESEWCKTTVNQGNGNSKIIVTVGVYSEMEDRNTNLTIKAGNITKVLTVTQKDGDAIILSKDKFDIPEEGGNVTVEVKSNIQYEVSIPSQFQNWIKHEPETKAITVKNFTFTILENKEYEKREGYIVFNGNSLKDTVHIYQTADPRTLILSKDTYNISSAKESIEVELKSNVDYSISIPSSASHWIKLLETKAIRTDKIYFEIEENTTYDNRSAQVFIKDKNSSLCDTLYINQLQQNALILSQKQYEVLAGGEQISIEVQSNIDYEIIIPKTVQEWIEQMPQSKAFTKSMINLEVKPNTTYDVRSAQVFIKDKNSSLCDTLYINQLQQNALILSQKQYEVLAGGEQISIEVQSNIDYEIIIPKTVQEWIEQMPQSKALTKSMINLEIKPNTTYDVRSAQVFIKDKNSTLSDTVQVTQAAKGTYTGDISFETEQDLIDFQTAGYTKVIGNIIVQYNIRTLQKLDNLLTEIDGNLTINCQSLTSLDGLYNLKKITGNFITWKACITSYEGIDKLTEIGGDFEVRLPYSLESFEGLESLETIGGNFKVIDKLALSSLSSFKGLSSLKSIGGDFEVNAKSSSLASFEGLENLETIGGNFKVIAESSFKGLNGLKSIGGDFEVNANSSLESFEGLESLETIGGNFKIIDNESSLNALSSFKGLSSLKSIGGDFEVNANSSLNSLSSFGGLESLETIGGNFRVIAESDHSLRFLSSFKGLSGLKSIGGDFEVNAKLFCFEYLASFEGLESLETIGGDFKVIAESSLKSLSSFKGLSSLKSIGEDFEVNTNSSLNALESFEGLESLETIGGNFKIIDNKSSLNALSSFKGLSSLKSIGGDFEVSTDHSSSPHPSHSLNALESFEGLESLETIGGNFRVIAESFSYSYSFNVLSSFKGLSSLKSIGGDFEVKARVLESFEGLENLTNIGDKLTIKGCSSLNNIDALKNIESLNDISITTCSKLYDFCVLKNVVQNMSGTFYVNDNGYNPTKYQLLNGECSQIPQE